MRGRWADHAVMELWWSFGGSGFIRADAMVRGHFSIFCSDSYVVNFVSYLVVVADKSSRVVLARHVIAVSYAGVNIQIATLNP